MSLTEQQIEEYERAIRMQQLATDEERIRTNEQQSIIESQEPSMISQQLDLSEELDRIDYLLRGYTLEKDEQGKNKWKAPVDNGMIILSDYGVHLIRNTIAWYLNKNTLLSNYDEDTILKKMEDFSSSLNDAVFMEYDKVFQYPSFEDCKKVLDERIKNKLNIKIFSLELLGKEVSGEEKKKIEEKLLMEMEPIIERELEKVKEQLMKNKLKRFDLIMRCVQDAVHSTYQRAWKGQERTTLRQHIHISETKGGNLGVQSSNNPFAIFKR